MEKAPLSLLQSQCVLWTHSSFSLSTPPPHGAAFTARPEIKNHPDRDLKIVSPAGRKRGGRIKFLPGFPLAGCPQNLRLLRQHH